MLPLRGKIKSNAQIDDTRKVRVIVLARLYTDDASASLWGRKTPSISRTESPNLNVSCLVLQLSMLNPLKPGVENEDVVGAAPTGDAPTISELSTILLSTEVQIILEVLRYDGDIDEDDDGVGDYGDSKCRHYGHM